MTITSRTGKYEYAFTVTLDSGLNDRILQFLNNHPMPKTEMCRQAIADFINRQIDKDITGKGQGQ